MIFSSLSLDDNINAESLKLSTRSFVSDYSYLLVSIRLLTQIAGDGHQLSISPVGIGKRMEHRTRSISECSFIVIPDLLVVH